MTDSPTDDPTDASTLDAPTMDAPARPTGPPGERPGDRIGPYRILRRIGQGGFGSVYEAEQDQPVKRHVALKVIKLGMDTREVIARFEAERQALAVMDHPHIARVLDAGTTEAGRPYFVMELVKGEPISTYGDEHRLPVDERLELFTQVCVAVQHAHTKGIIHRDIKPSNVLVSTHDDRPFARVIDFGIAKATSGPLTDRTLLTAVDQMIGTPAYMSPEQAGASVDIDTRTDIYSLGVLLYELLTGTTPFPSTALRGGYSEVQRIIREVEPPRPSTRLSESGAALAEVATRRRTEPAKLTGEVRGELDWIVMKAMEKDRSRRYETANGLAMDIRRYRAGEPVLAAPPSATYQLRKLVGRHRGVVAAGLLLAASLLAGLLAFAWQARIARSRARELEQVARFQAGMLAQVDATAAGKLLSEDVRARLAAALAKAGIAEAERARDLEVFDGKWKLVNATDAARELIDRTILRPAVGAIDKEFEKQPVVAATLRQVLADRYHELGLYDASSSLQSQALQGRRAALGDEHPDTLTSIQKMGDLLVDQGKLKEAEGYEREALEKRRRVLGPEHPDTLVSISRVGAVLQMLGRQAEAEPFSREALETQRRVLGEDHPDTLKALNNMGSLLGFLGRYAEAEPFYRQAMEKRRRVLGEENPRTLNSIANVCSVLYNLGRLREAEPYCREVTVKRRRTQGEEHPDTLRAVTTLGTMLRGLGRTAEAEELLLGGLATQRRTLGDEHPDTLVSMLNLADLLLDAGKDAEAERYARSALEGNRRVRGLAHGTTLNSAYVLGRVLLQQGRMEEAEPLLVEAADGYRKLVGEADPDTLRAVTGLAALRVAQGRFAEAERLLSASEAPARRALVAENAQDLATFLLARGRARAGLGDLAAAETSLLEARAILAKGHGSRQRETRDTARALADLQAARAGSTPPPKRRS